MTDVSKTARAERKNSNRRYAMSLRRLCISTAAAAFVAVGGAACGGDTETVTVQSPAESPASGTSGR